MSTTLSLYPGVSDDSIFAGDNTGATEISDAFFNAILRNINADTGISHVHLPAGKFKMNLEIAGALADQLIAAGCNKIVVTGAGPKATRIVHDVNKRALHLNLSHLATGPFTVSAIDLAAHASFDFIHRLTVTGLSTEIAKDDLCIIHSLNHPEYDSSFERWVGEGFRVKNVDAANDYVWVDGRLEYALDGLYTSNMRIYRLSKALTMDVYDVGFYPTSDTELDATARTTQSVALMFTMVQGCDIARVHFEDPWWMGFRSVSCCDMKLRNSTAARGINYPDASDRISYAWQYYASCFNCVYDNVSSEGFRHITTSDGNGSSDTTANSSNSFTTVNGSPTVTVNDTSHGLVAGDLVRFNGSTSANNVTITGVYQVQSAPTANTFTITAATNANASGSFGSSVAYSQYRASQKDQYGQPSLCITMNCHNDAARGAPWDTHIEGANIQFINCTSSNPHTSDVTGFIGAHAQVRARRVTFKDCHFFGGNNGISVKMAEHGANNWIKIINCRVHQLSQASDQGRGLLVANESGQTPTNKTKIDVINSVFEECGISIEVDNNVDLFLSNVKSERPHRGHFDIAGATSTVLATSLLMDSRSANLPGAATANRTLFGFNLAASTVTEVRGLTHVNGTDNARHVPAIFAPVGGSTRTVGLFDYREIDPSGIGRRAILTAGSESQFLVSGGNVINRSRTFTAAGNVTMLAFEDTLIVNKGTGAATTVTLPANPIPFKPYTVKDGRGDAATNFITVTPSSGTIDGVANNLLNEDYAARTFMFDGTNWFVIGASAAQGQIVPLFVLTAADTNSTADQSFTKIGSFTNYIPTEVIATRNTGSSAGAVGGIYTAAGKTGVPILPAGCTGWQQITAAGRYARMTMAKNADGVTDAPSGLILTATPIFSLTTATGVASTRVNIIIYGRIMD